MRYTEQIKAPSADESPSHKVLREIVTAIYEAKFQVTEMHLGQMLTLADASFSDPQQRKAFKDVVRNYLYNTKDYHFDNLIWALGEAFTADQSTNIVLGIGIDVEIPVGSSLLKNVKLMVKD